MQKGGDVMYIEPFWCGVVATILFELGSILVYGAITEWKKRRNEEP